MTTEETPNAPDLDRMNANLEKVETLTQRLVAAMSQKKPVNPALQGPGQDLFAKATAAYMEEMMSNPAKIIEHQVGYWGTALRQYMDVQQAFLPGDIVRVS